MLKNYKMFVESLNARNVINDKNDIGTGELDKKAWKKFKFALITLSNKHPFFSDVLYELKVLMTYKVERMATDGSAILFNPNWMLSDELDGGNENECQDVVFIIAHEIMHVVFNHMQRSRDLKMDTKEEHYLWNVAGDYAINIALDDGLGNAIGHKPDWVLYDKKLVNLSTDAIYNKIVNDEPDKPFVPPMPPEPGDGDSEPHVVVVGDYIRTKKGKKFGKITKLYSDGTFDYDEVTKEEATQAMKQ